MEETRTKRGEETGLAADAGVVGPPTPEMADSLRLRPAFLPFCLNWFELGFMSLVTRRAPADTTCLFEYDNSNPS